MSAHNQTKKYTYKLNVQENTTYIKKKFKAQK